MKRKMTAWSAGTVLCCAVLCCVMLCWGAPVAGTAAVPVAAAEQAEAPHWEADGDASHFEWLFPEGQDGSTGWWHNPVEADQTFSVEFTATDWFDGVLSYAYGAEVPVPFLVELFDDRGDLVGSVEYTHSQNSYMNIDFGTALAPGDYELLWTVLPYEGTTYWVVACTPKGPDLPEVYVTAPNAQIASDMSNFVPWIKLHRAAEPDPTAMPDPTETPDVTATPEPTATPEVTEAPETTAGSEGAGAPTGTGGAASVAPGTGGTSAPAGNGAQNTARKTSTGMIVGIVIGAVVIVAAVAVIVTVLRKRRKG